MDITTLYPLDFEDFLWATGNQPMRELILQSYADFTPLSLHDTTLDRYRTYLVVGGMPRAVMEYIENRDFDFV